jgi:hypothetical protein
VRSSISSWFLLLLKQAEQQAQAHERAKEHEHAKEFERRECGDPDRE